MLCILPLSHIYARTCDLYTWIVSGSRLVLGENRRDIAGGDCQIRSNPPHLMPCPLSINA